MLGCVRCLTAPQGPVRHWCDWPWGRLFLALMFGEDGKDRGSEERDGHWDIAQSCSVAGRSSGSHSLAFTSWSLKLTHSTCRVVFPWPHVTEHWKHTHTCTQITFLDYLWHMREHLAEHSACEVLKSWWWPHLLFIGNPVQGRLKPKPELHSRNVSTTHRCNLEATRVETALLSQPLKFPTIWGGGHTFQRYRALLSPSAAHLLLIGLLTFTTWSSDCIPLVTHTASSSAEDHSFIFLQMEPLVGRRDRVEAKSLQSHKTV